MTKSFVTVILCLIMTLSVIAQETTTPKRIGIIGATTSHVPAFTNQINDPNGPLSQRFQVTAAYAGGMPDNPSSWDRVAEYTKYLVDKGVTMYPTIEEMLKHVDFVMLESVDGRPHLEQAKPVIVAGKPMYIDKPIAGSLADALEIYRLAEEHKVPIFSASSLRYGKGLLGIRDNPQYGRIIGCDAIGPCSLNDKHPDFYWYGIHGIETLFTVMGTGCKSVSRTHSSGTDFAVGLWEDGRIGTFRGIRAGQSGYSARVFAEKAIVEVGQYDGYDPLVIEICKFFDTLQPPFDPQETIEIFAFMTAADISKAEGGRVVTLEETIARAKTEVSVIKNIVIPTNYGQQQPPSVFVGGQKVATSELKATLKPQETCEVVKVILCSEKDVDFKDVQEVLEQLDEVYLANYLYE
jgi:predicted dehydrogenase